MSIHIRDDNSEYDGSESDWEEDDSVNESSKQDEVEDSTLTTSLSADIKSGDLAKIVTLKELRPLTKQEKLYVLDHYFRPQSGFHAVKSMV